MVKLTAFGLLLSSVVTSVATAGPLDASNVTCSKQRISTPPVLFGKIAFADGPHEVVCKLQEMGHSSATVSFAVNNYKMIEPREISIRKRTYQEIVNSFWASANRLAKSAKTEHAMYRDHFSFRGHALDYYIPGGPSNIFSGNIGPTIDASNVNWEGINFYGQFQFVQEDDPFSFALSRIEKGDPIIIHPWMGRNVLETAYLGRISLSYVKNDKDMTPAVATETRNVALDLFRTLYSRYGDKVHFALSSNGANATLEADGVLYNVSYTETGRIFADLIVDIGRKPR